MAPFRRVHATREDSSSGHVITTNRKFHVKSVHFSAECYCSLCVLPLGTNHKASETKGLQELHDWADLCTHALAAMCVGVAGWLGLISVLQGAWSRTTNHMWQSVLSHTSIGRTMQNERVTALSESTYRSSEMTSYSFPFFVDLLKVPLVFEIETASTRLCINHSFEYALRWRETSDGQSHSNVVSQYAQCNGNSRRSNGGREHAANQDFIKFTIGACHMFSSLGHLVNPH
eukprot:5075928-Amphidinium_carterae.2